MRLSTRIWLPTAILSLSLAGLASLMLLRTQVDLHDNELRLSDQQAKVIDSQAWTTLTQGNAIRTQATLQGGDPALDAVLGVEMTAVSQRITEIQQRISARSPDGEEKAALDRIDAARKAYLGARDVAKKLKTEGQAEAARAAWANQVQAPLAGYLASQQAYVELQTERSRAQRASAAAAQMTMLWRVAGALALLAAGLLVATALVVRAISRPLAGLADVARRIGEGDLTVEVEADRDDEVGAVSRSLAQMRDALRGIVGQVRQSAESIQLASAEVASGNLDLSQRTEQAASSLQQTAGSIEQLTSHVRQSADSAAQANQLAASASSAATRGGEVVAKVVSTMDDINIASKRIADIIGTIDGIAFQTNILALNAAVEAARAGEQGRGFAVVAGEVRSLAQRSAEAAREIKGLISASVEKVETGAKLVGDAGATMTDIVSSVQRVSAIIAEITTASAGQSSGIVSVNSAVGELDQMTQQNAALVEQSAAAAESLRDQAKRLSQAISVFQIRAPGPESGGAARRLDLGDAASTQANAASKPAAVPASTTARPSAASWPTATSSRSTTGAAAEVARPAAKPIAKPAAPSASTAAAAKASTADDEWETF